MPLLQGSPPFYSFEVLKMGLYMKTVEFTNKTGQKDSHCNILCFFPIMVMNKQIFSSPWLIQIPSLTCI